MLRTVALPAVAALLLTACPEDPAEPDDPVVEDEEPIEDEPDPDPEPEVDTEPADVATVAVASTDLGDVLVDGDGMTLYMFEPDEQGDPTCYDDCAEAWPPLLTGDEPAAGDGADAALVGTAQRDDGTTQVTYDGWPLYRWAADEAPGDTTGQGFNDIWWVLDADGTPIRDADAGGSGAGDGMDEEQAPSY
jgi:predicted lipoprotein with Yx(FWY)xxD motif